MVFENLTLFELHFENSRFGPSFGGEEDESEPEESIEAADEDGGRGSRMRPLGVLLFLVVLAVAARRFRARRGGEEGAVDAESEQITIEHAAEQ